MSRRAIVLVLLAGIACFHFATLTNGHGWGDDFAQYIMHAKNIVEHKPYAQTGYVYNRLAPSVGPRSYPPGFPVLLATVYAVKGMDWLALKSVSVVCMLLALAAIAALFWNELSTLSMAALLLGVGLNPVLWTMKEQILSDLTFMMFLFGSL